MSPHQAYSSPSSNWLRRSSDSVVLIEPGTDKWQPLIAGFEHPREVGYVGRKYCCPRARELHESLRTVNRHPRPADRESGPPHAFVQGPHFSIGNYRCISSATRRQSKAARGQSTRSASRASECAICADSAGGFHPRLRSRVQCCCCCLRL